MALNASTRTFKIRLPVALSVHPLVLPVVKIDGRHLLFGLEVERLFWADRAENVQRCFYVTWNTHKRRSASTSYLESLPFSSHNILVVRAIDKCLKVEGRCSQLDKFKNADLERMIYSTSLCVVPSLSRSINRNSLVKSDSRLTLLQSEIRVCCREPDLLRRPLVLGHRLLHHARGVLVLTVHPGITTQL